MLVSIIVPVYNVKNYLVKCLDSIHHQTFDDYEVIVVDDGSTDGCSEIVDFYCQDKPKFHVFHKVNGGLMSAWIEGVTHASGEYFGFVDSDDYIDPDMFQKMSEYAVQYNCDIVMCDRFDVKGSMTVAGKSCIEPGLYRDEQIDVIYKNILPKFSGNHITNARWNKLFRRELFLENIVYCEHRSRICEDRFITPACMFDAKSFYYIGEPLYYYVNRDGSNHSKASDELQKTMELLYTTQLQMLKDKKMDGKYRELVERANLNYLRLLIMRNFSRNVDRQKRIIYAKQILSSSGYGYCIRKYPNDLKGKLGLALKVLFRINNPILFEYVCKRIR